MPAQKPAAEYFATRSAWRARTATVTDASASGNVGRGGQPSRVKASTARSAWRSRWFRVSITTETDARGEGFVPAQRFLRNIDRNPCHIETMLPMAPLFPGRLALVRWATRWVGRAPGWKP